MFSNKQYDYLRFRNALLLDIKFLENFPTPLKILFGSSPSLTSTPFAVYAALIRRAAGGQGQDARRTEYIRSSKPVNYIESIISTYYFPA